MKGGVQKAQSPLGSVGVRQASKHILPEQRCWRMLDCKGVISHSINGAMI